MKYTKPPLSFEKQADLLIDRGLIADKDVLVARLKSVNYYRLSGYLHPFKLPDDSFKAGTTLDMVWQNYCFDRQLRLLIIDVIERFEIALKTDITYILSHTHGAFGYLDVINFPFLSNDEYTKLIENIQNETMRSKEVFVKHFFKKYGDQHKFLPLWMAAEVFSLGTVHTVYKGIPLSIKQQISKKYNISPKVLTSWIHTIQVVRNICAHHGRIYNRTLGVSSIIPKKNSDWHTPFTINNDKIFSVLSILKYLLDIIAPQSNWKNRLIKLIDENNMIPLNVMGFSKDWENHLIWK
ncbi:MAG: Abi family protein [Spirochaetes bacterium]|nr:Abi family protein [Spirochaetota bacterium]